MTTRSAASGCGRFFLSRRQQIAARRVGKLAIQSLFSALRARLQRRRGLATPHPVLRGSMPPAVARNRRRSLPFGSCFNNQSSTLCLCQRSRRQAHRFGRNSPTWKHSSSPAKRQDGTFRRRDPSLRRFPVASGIRPRANAAVGPGVKEIDDKSDDEPHQQARPSISGQAKHQE